MSLIRRGVEARSAGYSQYFGNTYNPYNLLYANTSVWSTAGERVDEVTALGVSAVLASVSLIADAVASMDVRAEQSLGNGRTEPIEVPAVIADPDPINSTPYEIRHMQVASMALHGTSYNLISRDKFGDPIGQLPLHPYQVQVLPDHDMATRRFMHLGREIPNDDMLAVRWFTMPQMLTGISPILQQRTMVGLALALDKYLAQWYGEGATPSGVLEVDGPLTTEAAKNLRETWEGSGRKHRRPAVLSHGMKWRPVSVSAVDMDYIATREAVTADIARIFRIPPYLLGIKDGSNVYQNVESASLNFLVHTLQPWITRLEIAYRKLVPPGVIIRFDPSSLLRMDSLTKARVQLTQIQSGTRTPNEARAVDGLPPYPGGDEFVQVLPGAPVDASAPAVGVDDDPTTPPVANG